MRLIKLTSLDGSERFIDADKVLDIGVTTVFYDSSSNSRISDLKGLQSDIDFHIEQEIRLLEQKLRFPGYQLREEELKQKLKTLIEDKKRIHKGLPPESDDRRLKEKWEALEDWQGKDIGCTFINLQTDGGTHSVLVKETPQEVVKILNHK